ncbi:MAG: DUF115 domain-containing protein [Candidatus Methanofastidiosa archaeon]|nr:DUF115 domain-containing protein [Candidatus Methanofastidiosa archaeon]
MENMKKIKRINSSEITLTRMSNAIRIRIKDIRHLIQWYLLPSAETNRIALKNFRNLHQGKRCFIVANGPSLRNTDLSLLKNEITFGLNRIYLNFSVSDFRPSYYISVNELVLSQYSDEIENLNMPKFVNWNMREAFHNNNNIFFLKPKFTINDYFADDISKPIVFGATVTFVALQIAYFMGFSQVILVGLDHNFVEKGIPNSIEKRKSDLDNNHFNPNYFPKDTKWQLPDLLRSEIDYQLANEKFASDNREILDATIGGKCHVFKKVDYLSVFSNA